jgi:adrenodoxin-NADP+ reductase
MRFCIVGSGPAGLFLAGRLLKKNPQAVINVVDSRLNPFGLVRYGVAPDHPEVKVTKVGRIL